MLHSFFLPFIMGRDKTLAQIDSAYATAWDALRAVGTGVVFIWAAVPAPVQALAWLYGISFCVLLMAHITSIYRHTESPRSMSWEIGRMMFFALLLLAVRAVVKATGATDQITVIFFGMLAWTELAMIYANGKRMGYNPPGELDKIVTALFDARSRIMQAIIGRLSRKDAEDIQASEPDTED